MAVEIIKSPFIQNIGGVAKQVNFETSSDQVLRPDASNVESALAALEASLEGVRTSLETFLTGEADDNGMIDRLKELVAAINTNKELIDGVLADESKVVGPDASVDGNLPVFDGETGKLVADSGVAKSEVEAAIAYSEKAWATTVAAIPEDEEGLAALTGGLHDGAIIVVDPSVNA